MDTKFWLDSNTVRGILVAAIPTVYQLAKLAGLEIPDGTLESIVDGCAAVLQLAGLVLAFWGRHTADKPLGYSK